MSLWVVVVLQASFIKDTLPLTAPQICKSYCFGRTNVVDRRPRTVTYSCFTQKYEPLLFVYAPYIRPKYVVHNTLYTAPNIVYRVLQCIAYVFSYTVQCSLHPLLLFPYLRESCNGEKGSRARKKGFPRYFPLGKEQTISSFKCAMQVSELQQQEEEKNERPSFTFPTKNVVSS